MNVINTMIVRVIMICIMRMIIQVLIKMLVIMKRPIIMMNREDENDASNCESNWHDINKIKNNFKTKIHDNANDDN